MSLPLVETALRFHLSLNVTDLNRSVAFYSVLFGMEPSKCHSDYAKFDLEEPPVVFSLTPHPPGKGGSISHLGLHVPDRDALEAIRQRLEKAGLPTQCQEGTVCGGARQNKVWVEDPDRNFWEIYEIEAEVDPAILRRSFDGATLPPPPVPAIGPVRWEHYVSNPVPARIPHDDATLDEVRLTGTFNAPLPPDAVQALIAEARRVLKPGGKVVTHGLMGDKPLGDKPSLPGLAALVAQVPTHLAPLAALREAGFSGLHYVKFTETPWFVVNGVELREVKLIGYKTDPDSSKKTREVLYKGPFRKATDEIGNVFIRGQCTTVTQTVWDLLRQGQTAGQFVFVEPGTETQCGCA